MFYSPELARPAEIELLIVGDSVSYSRSMEAARLRASSKFKSSSAFPYVKEKQNNLKTKILLRNNLSSIYNNSFVNTDNVLRSNNTHQQHSLWYHLQNNMNLSLVT